MWGIAGGLLVAVSIILFFWVSGFVVRRMPARHEIVRKGVHILSGTACAISVFLCESPVPLLVLVGFFVPFFVISARLQLFPGVYRKDRRSYGPAYLAAACGILFILFWSRKEVIFIALMTAAWGDSLAAVVGTTFPHGRYEVEGNRRTFSGSVTLFLVTLLVVAVCLAWLTVAPLKILSIACACALFVTAVESVSPSDADNLTVPLMCAALLFLMLPLSPSGTLLFWEKAAVALLVAAVSWRAGFLDAGGAVGVFLIGTLIFAIGGVAWLIPMFIFFVSSSLISLWRKERKKHLRDFHAKSGPRDLKQVLAKGGIPCLLALWFSATADHRLYFAYLCSLAAANADTWASEIGFFSPRTPISIISLRPVSRGTSGGVSMTGYFAAVLGAFSIGLVGFPFLSSGRLPAGPGFLALVAAAGVFACTVDSILGATAQARLRCPRCGEVTENPNHCRESPGVLASGRIWINNDTVNLACSFAGAAFAVIVASFW